MHYTLIKNARVVDVRQRKAKDTDLLLRHENDGVSRIEAIALGIERKTLSEHTVTIVNAHGNVILPSFTDLSVCLREPGAMYKEDLASTCRAAMAGGYHQLLAYFEPDARYTTKDALQYMRTAFDSAPIGLYPAASVGSEPCEDLFAAGAVTLTDRFVSPMTEGELLTVMKCCAEADKTFMASSYEPSLLFGGSANSGIASVMGMKGITPIAEELAVVRLLLLAEAAGCRVHVSGVSTKRALACIRKAKEEGLPVTCDVSPHHFFFDENAVVFHGNAAKLMPPLRSAEDREAVIAAIADGTVDAVASHHVPHDKRDLACRFPDAPFGAVALETTFSACVEGLISPGHIDVFRLCELLALAPHRILRQAGAAIPETVSPIAVGEPASFNLVSFDRRVQIEEGGLKGRAKNTPFLGMYLQGRVEKSFVSKALT